LNDRLYQGARVPIVLPSRSVGSASTKRFQLRELLKEHPSHQGLRHLQESVGKSRRDAMFIEKLEPIDLRESIYGRTIVGCAPKGATTSQLCLPFYRHFTATRFFRRTPSAGRVFGWWERECASVRPCFLAAAWSRHNRSARAAWNS